VQRGRIEIPAFLLYRSYVTVSVFWHEAVVEGFWRRFEIVVDLKIQRA
jgi:hypothetical protein